MNSKNAGLIKIITPIVFFCLTVGFGAGQLLKSASDEVKAENWRLDNHGKRLDNIDAQNKNFHQEVKNLNGILTEIKLQQREFAVTQKHILNAVEEIKIKVK